MKKWVAAWGVATSRTQVQPASYGKDVTFRYVLRSSVAGSALRLHFANMGSDEHVRIDRVTVVNLNSDAESSTVLFDGDEALEMEGRTKAMSDEVKMEIHSGDDIAVSMYIGSLTHLASGVNSTGPLCRASFAEGDQTGLREMPFVHRNNSYGYFHFLTVADVLADESCNALVAFGDSITAQSWPDQLALRLMEEGNDHLTVVRRGIGGNRVLREYTHMQNRHYGPKGVDRFESEILVSGADRVVVLHGVNDIIHPDGENPCRPWSDLPTAEELINGLREYIATAHRHGMKIYIATITPIKGWSTWIPERDVIRDAVNEWIRTTDEHDGCVDFAKAICNPEDEHCINTPYDSGDHLHPSIEGARCMAANVPAEYLK